MKRVLALVILGLLTAVSLGVATNARLEGFRPAMLGLFVAAVVIPIWERVARARAADEPAVSQ